MRLELARMECWISSSLEDDCASSSWLCSDSTFSSDASVAEEIQTRTPAMTAMIASATSRNLNAFTVPWESVW